MTTTQKLAQLKKLFEEARKNIRLRVKYAAEVLADPKWLASAHNGDDIKAHDSLEDDFFADYKAMGLTLGRLIQIYRELPEKTWVENKSNIAVLNDILETQESSRPAENQPKRKTKSWKDECLRLEEENANLKMRIQVLEGKLEELREVASREVSYIARSPREKESVGV